MSSHTSGGDGEKGKDEESNPMILGHDNDKLNDNSPRDAEENKDDDDGGVTRLFSLYADKCSIHGINFIKSSKYLLVKLIWTLLLCTTLTVSIGQVYKLGSKYYSYPKQTKVDLGFEPLRFPAVTLCNVNALRMSRLRLASQKLQKVIDEMTPDELAKGEKRHLTNMTSHHNTTEISSLEETDDSNVDDYKPNGSWQDESEPSAFDTLVQRFVRLYSREKSRVRKAMGHQLDDLIVRCSFAGRKCLNKQFKIVPNARLGNCHTIQYNKFISRVGGPADGLSLTLNLETHEYVPGITNSKGAQLVIHEPGTVPYPNDDGMALGAGSETKIGLRRVSITRLGDPHGDCVESSDFMSNYGIEYTRQTCQSICRMERIQNTCTCYDRTKPAIYSLLPEHKNLVACQSKIKLLRCMKEVKLNFRGSRCGCFSPCKEIKYHEVVSSRPWPTPLFAGVIAKNICEEKPKSKLCKFDKMGEIELRENFVKVDIYFKSLDYESITEEPDYTFVQFLSDIGGTVGLYVGFSVLSLFEIVHLAISIFRYLCCKNACKGTS